MIKSIRNKYTAIIIWILFLILFIPRISDFKFQPFWGFLGDTGGTLVTLGLFILGVIAIDIDA